MPQIYIASQWWAQFSHTFSGFWLYHMVALSLSFCLSFYKENKWGKCVSFLKCDTVLKLSEKRGTFLKHESWKPPPSGLVQGRHFARPSRGPRHLGIVYLEGVSTPAQPGACWGFGWSWKFSRLVPVVLPWSPSLLNLRESISLWSSQCAHIFAPFGRSAHMFPMTVNYEKLSGPFNHYNGL